MQDIGGGGRRHRQNAVGTAHLTAAQMHRTGNNLFRCQHVQQQADGGHIRHCVQRAHLVEVNLIHRAAVGGAFRLGNNAVDLQRLLLYLRGQISFLNGLLHPCHGGVMMMPVAMIVFMGMVVAVLLFPVHQHLHMQALYTAFLCGIHLDLNPWQQPVHLLQKRLLLLHTQQVQQGGGEHIACRTHDTFNI